MGAAVAVVASVVPGFPVSFALAADDLDSLGATAVAGPRLDSGFVQQART